MTAVPFQRTKRKDPFQVELNKELEKRKSRGLKTGFSDDDDDEIDDYADDFLSDDSSDDFLKEYSKPSVSSKKPSSSINNNGTTTQKELKDFLKDFDTSKSFSTKKSHQSTFGRQKPVDDTRKSFEKNPLFSLLEEEPEPNLLSTGKFKSKTEESTHRVERSPSPSINSQRMRMRQSGNLLEDTMLSPRSQTSVTGKDERSLTSQSLIDHVLSGTKPNPKPRKKMTIDDEDLLSSYTRSRHSSGKSTTSVHSEKQKSIKSPRNEQLKSIENTTPKETSQLDFLKSLPSLEPTKAPRRAEKPLRRQKPETATSMKDLELKEKLHQSQSTLQDESKLLQSKDETKPPTTDDLLALFEQSAISDNALHDKVAKANVAELDLTRQQTQPKSPAEVVAELTAEQAAEKPIQRKTTNQLLDNVINNVADHNETYILNKDEIDAKEKLESKETKPRRSSSARPKSSLKSPRRPPADYKGLGSLSSLQLLQTYSKDSSQTLNLNSTADIRNSIYMDWLADREKKLRAKKKEKQKAEEKENEKKEKALRDKYLEGESARRAWLESKEGGLKEAARKKKREERRKREEALNAEEEKWKSTKKADVVRERKLAEAKKRHREEMKKKREEEMLLERKKMDKKKENDKARKEWEEKRSMRWVEDRQKEMREKRKKEKALKEAQTKKTEKGLEIYTKWREDKDQNIQETHRIHYHEEERPPWSPPNKVIPRQR